MKEELQYIGEKIVKNNDKLAKILSERRMALLNYLKYQSGFR
ncbi:hypothetical protein ABEQ41_30385 [Priestia megaterium]